VGLWLGLRSGLWLGLCLWLRVWFRIRASSARRAALQWQGSQIAWRAVQGSRLTSHGHQITVQGYQQPLIAAACGGSALAYPHGSQP
jgi:hypothetical protein